MITGFRVKNLRAITDTGDISLRRINVVVGKNSSGKSTLLRTLPLLRQSVEQPTKGPLLWYGRLVDFGNFRNAARDSDSRRGIEFSFEFSISARQLLVHRPSLRRFLPPNLRASSRSGLRGNISIVLGRSEGDVVGDIRKMEVNFGEDRVRITYAPNGDVAKLEIGNNEIAPADSQKWMLIKGGLIPGLEIFERHYVDFGEDEGNRSFWEPSEDPFLDVVIQAVSELAHGNTSNDKLISIARRLGYSGAQDFYENILNMTGVTPMFRSNVELNSVNSVAIQKLRQAVLLNKLPIVLRILDDELTSFSKSVRYIEPIRATAERYYRQQDLAVDDIDSRGTNTAMFLTSLDAAELDELRQWMSSHLGFNVHTDSSAGHVELKIVDEFGVSRNIADLGFGYSQMLPIILQLWIGSRRKSAEGDLVAIEQPELHLHPHYQALLADLMVMATAASRPKSRLRLFVETHSDHFVNRLGALVASGRLQESDVQIIVVESSGGSDSSVTSCEFDEDGLFDSNWPAGFFEASLP